MMEKYKKTINVLLSLGIATSLAAEYPEGSLDHVPPRPELHLAEYPEGSLDHVQPRTELHLDESDLSQQDMNLQKISEDRLTQLEKEMKQVWVENNMGTAGALFAPPIKPTDCHWFIDIETFVWHTKAGGVDWAIDYNQAIYPINGSMHTLDFKWDWGFRLGVGRLFNYGAWDVSLLYTYFNTRDSAKLGVTFTTPPGTGKSGHLQSPFGLSHGSFSTHLYYNALDIDVGRGYCISRDLVMHPYVGLKGILLAQTYRLNTLNMINASNSFLSTNGTITSVAQNKNNVWGLGPHITIDSFWNLGHSWQIVGALEGALLQSYFEVKQTETLNIAPTGAPAVDTSSYLTGLLHHLLPYARLQFGVVWELPLHRAPNHSLQRLFHFSITYEANYFWRANQTLSSLMTIPHAPSFSSTQSVRTLFRRTSEDICFYGFTGQMKVSF
jgi:hypothetical protein